MASLPSGRLAATCDATTGVLGSGIKVPAAQITSSKAAATVNGSTLSITSDAGTTSTVTLPASTSTGGGLTLSASRIASL